jgi:ABC-type glutathione transport system ATPase component
MASLLEIENLRVWFGATEVVRGVSLTLDAGEVLGLVGESGWKARSGGGGRS